MARVILDGVVVGMVVTEVNIKHCGTSPQLTCPCTQEQVLQSIGWPVGVNSLNCSPDVKFFPPCWQVHSIFLVQRSTPAPADDTSGVYVAGQVQLFSLMVTCPLVMASGCFINSWQVISAGLSYGRSQMMVLVLTHASTLGTSGVSGTIGLQIQQPAASTMAGM